MQVIISEPAAIAIRTLSDDDQRRVEAWCNQLANWETDAFVRERAHALEMDETVLVLRTSTDIRLFFTVEKDRIVVLDVARKDALRSFRAPAK